MHYNLCISVLLALRYVRQVLVSKKYKQSNPIMTKRGIYRKRWNKT